MPVLSEFCLKTPVESEAMQAAVDCLVEAVLEVMEASLGLRQEPIKARFRCHPQVMLVVPASLCNP